MLFADNTLLEWFGAIGGGITAVGMAVLGLYFFFRKNRTSANEADNTATYNARKQQMSLDSEALNKVIDDLRKDNDSLRTQMGVIQNGTLVKIIEAHDEHHECERKYAALEEKYNHVMDKNVALETRLKVLEGKSNGPTA